MHQYGCINILRKLEGNKMNIIAKLSSEDRKFVFLKTSETLGKSTSIIEKDYWVCYLLDYLFTKSEFKDM